MRETGKAGKHATRQALYEAHLFGRGIDIGSGTDPLIASGEVSGIDTFDKPDGNAQNLRGDRQYEFAYSSHCLEHMEDVPLAIRNWSTLVRQFGRLFLVLPDFVLYERMQWPSRYNSDHKAAFSLFAIDPSMRPEKFYGFTEMKAIGADCGLELVHAEIEAHGYEFVLLNYTFIDQTIACDACANCVFIFKKL